MKKPLLFKINIAYIFLTTFIIGVFSVFLFANQVSIINENLINRIKLQSLALKDLDNLWGDESVSFNALTKKLSDLNFPIYEVYNELGERKLGKENKETSQAFDTEMINMVFTKLGYGQDPLLFSIIRDRIIVYLPVSLSGNIYVVKIISDFKDSSERLKSLYSLSLILGLVALLINIAFAIYMYNLIFVRLRKIELLSIKISEGNYDVDFEDKKHDEISIILKTIKSLAIEAKEANALSGLAGNNAINREITKRLSNEVFAVLYIDLDNFKAYNDKYGFNRGDDAILYTAEVLKSIKQESFFVGHIGGDDFVVITPYDKAEDTAKAICVAFDSNITQFYNEEDNLGKCIVSKDREGNVKTFPLMSLSIAIISNKFKKVEHLSEFLDSSGLIKKKIKKQAGRTGSSFLEDRGNEY